MKIYKISQNSFRKPSILLIAKKVRLEAVKNYGDESLKEVCLQVSKDLKEEFVRNGYDAIVVRGTFTVDIPDPMALKEWDANAFENDEEMEDAKYNPVHYWVEINGMIIDITATQFNNELDSPMHPIVIGSYSSQPRYKIINKDWI